MAISNLSTQYISASYQNLLQISASGEIFDGTGTQVTKLLLTSVTASLGGLVSSASVAITANSATTAISASYATTASFALNVPNTVNGNFTVNGTLTANNYVISSSVINETTVNVSGSTRFGNSIDDTHKYTGSLDVSGSARFLGDVVVSGSLTVTSSNTFTNYGPTILAGPVTITGIVSSSSAITGSVFGTASYASNAAQLNSQAASYYLNASNINAGTIGNSYLPTAINTTSVTASFNGNLAGTSSWASYAVTASYALNGGGVATDTGSLLVTASVNSNVITFTKGNSSTFSITVNTGSAGGGSGTVSSGTAGRVTYYPTSNTTVDDAGTLYWDNSNNSLGVGTAAPTTTNYKLAVNGGIDVADNTYAIVRIGAHIATSGYPQAVIQLGPSATRFEFEKYGGGTILKVEDTGQVSATEFTGSFNANSKITIQDGNNIVLGTSTGTKIGTSTSQKLGFFNTNPIVQPTTGVTGAVFTNGAGPNITDDATFDGYTIAKVVAALRNLGLLA